MKILYINEYFTEKHKSGANIVAYNNYMQMKKMGFECYFFSNNLEPYIEKLNISQYYPTCHLEKNDSTSMLIFRINSVFNVQAKRQLKNVINKIKPDFVHIHGIMELSYSIIQVLKDKNIPYILTMHDAGIICPIYGTPTFCTQCAKNIFYVLYNRCSKNNIMASLYVAFRCYVAKKILKTYPPVQIIVPSEALKKYIQKSKQFENIDITIIPNSLDETFEQSIPNYNNGKYFLYVGNLSDNKGVLNLLEAIKLVNKNIEFHIVGIGNCKEKYDKYILDNNLTNVKMIGVLGRKDLAKEYSDSIATIVPSIGFEVFGMINIESFALGKPVIASNSGGISEIVEHNVNGFIYEPQDIKKLAEYIELYNSNPELVSIHGQNGYDKVQKQYLKNRYIHSLLEVYKKTMERYCDAT